MIGPAVDAGAVPSNPEERCRRRKPMTSAKRGAVFTAGMVSLVAVALVVSFPAPSWAEIVQGKIEKVENGGRSVTLAGKIFGVSGSRTNICIKGVCDQNRDQLKAGQACEADIGMRDGKPEARKISCR
jgi:hypothetical protein